MNNILDKKSKISNGTKKCIIFILLISLFEFTNFSTASAWGFGGFGFMGRVFGGRIIHEKAIEIEALESAGYTCLVFGTSFSMIPIGSPSGTPVSYFVPAFVTSRTGNAIGVGKQVIGKYSGKTSITCIYPNPPHTIDVSLDTVNFYGVSGSGFGGFGGGKSGGGGASRSDF